MTRAIRQHQTWIHCWMGLEVDKKSPNIGSTMSIGDRQGCADHNNRRCTGLKVTLKNKRMVIVPIDYCGSLTV
jgi:hypothetical protein